MHRNSHKVYEICFNNKFNSKKKVCLLFRLLLELLFLKIARIEKLSKDIKK